MFTQPYLATITVFAGNFAPRGWAYCDGSLLSISENSALFSLIGTTYGGDGEVTFALPNLQSRIAVHPGNGQVIGLMNGMESVVMTTQSMASHNHIATSFAGAPPASNVAGGLNTPIGNVPGQASTNMYNASADGLGLSPSSSQTATVPSGNNQPIETLQPYTAMSYIIATEGIYPTQG